MTTDPETGERHVRPFGEWLLAEANGRLHGDLSDTLNELIAAVCDTNKKGSLALTVTVAPATKNDDGDVVMVTVTPTVVLKAPRLDVPTSIHFVDRWANLKRDNPAQPVLPMRAVPEPAPVRTAGEGGA